MILTIEQIILRCIGAFGGTLGYAYILNAPVSTVLPASITGLVGYLIYELLVNFAGCGALFAYFISTVVISVACEIEARVMRMPSTIFLLTALVPLVPGYTFYLAMLSMVEDKGHLAAAYGLEAVQIVAAIAVGAAVTSVLFRTMMAKPWKKKTV